MACRVIKTESPKSADENGTFSSGYVVVGVANGGGSGKSSQQYAGGTSFSEGSYKNDSKSNAAAASGGKSRKKVWSYTGKFGRDFIKGPVQGTGGYATVSLVKKKRSRCDSLYVVKQINCTPSLSLSERKAQQHRVVALNEKEKFEMLEAARQVNEESKEKGASVVRYYWCYGDQENSPQVSLVLELCSGGNLLENIKARFQEGCDAETACDNSASASGCSSSSDSPGASGSAGGLRSPRVIYSEEEAFAAFIQMLSALEFIAQCHIVHMDGSAANWMYNHKNKYHVTNKQRLKLIDFGMSCISADVNDAAAPSTKVVGTPGYIAPEVLKRERVTCKADIWSLGVVLYNMLTGCAPFDIMDRSNERVLNGQLNKSTYWNNLSPAAQDIIERMLTVNVANRITLSQLREHRWVTNPTGKERGTQAFDKEYPQRITKLINERGFRISARCALVVSKFFQKLRLRRSLRQPTGLPAASSSASSSSLTLSAFGATKEPRTASPFTLVSGTGDTSALYAEDEMESGSGIASQPLPRVPQPQRSRLPLLPFGAAKQPKPASPFALVSGTGDTSALYAEDEMESAIGIAWQLPPRITPADVSSGVVSSKSPPLKVYDIEDKITAESADCDCTKRLYTQVQDADVNSVSQKVASLTLEETSDPTKKSRPDDGVEAAAPVQSMAAEPVSSPAVTLTDIKLLFERYFPNLAKPPMEQQSDVANAHRSKFKGSKVQDDPEDVDEEWEVPFGTFFEGLLDFPRLRQFANMAFYRLFKPNDSWIVDGRNVLLALATECPREEKLTTEWQAFCFHLFDENDDGVISLEEFIRHMGYFVPDFLGKEEGRIAAGDSDNDDDDNDSMQQEEVGRIEMCFSAIDTNGDEVLNFDEFQHWVVKDCCGYRSIVATISSYSGAKGGTNYFS